MIESQIKVITDVRLINVEGLISLTRLVFIVFVHTFKALSDASDRVQHLALVGLFHPAFLTEYHAIIDHVRNLRLGVLSHHEVVV